MRHTERKTSPRIRREMTRARRNLKVLCRRCGKPIVKDDLFFTNVDSRSAGAVSYKHYHCFQSEDSASG